MGRSSSGQGRRTRAALRADARGVRLLLVLAMARLVRSDTLGSAPSPLVPCEGWAGSQEPWVLFGWHLHTLGPHQRVSSRELEMGRGVYGERVPILLLAGTTPRPYSRLGQSRLLKNGAIVS